MSPTTINFKSQILILIGVIALLAGCKNKKAELYGLSFNSTREKLGIPKLPPNWDMISDVLDRDLEWITPTECINCYSRKLVTLKRGILYSDFNEFISSKSFEYFDGNGKEKIYIDYNFVKDSSRSQDTGLRFYHVSKSDLSGEVEISKDSAIAVLKSWGIEY